MPATKQQNVDYEWYQKNLKKIYKTFGNKYVVIYKSQVLNSFDTFEEGADYIENNNLIGKAIVQKSGKDKNAYTINMNLPIAKGNV